MERQAFFSGRTQWGDKPCLSECFPSLWVSQHKVLGYVLVEPPGKCYQYKYVENLVLPMQKKPLVWLLVNRRRFNENPVFLLASCFYLLIFNGRIDNVEPTPQWRALFDKIHSAGWLQDRRAFHSLLLGIYTTTLWASPESEFSDSLHWALWLYKMASRQSRGFACKGC